MKLCTNCRFYQSASEESLDKCAHEKAKFGGVREVKTFACSAMRAGICGAEARLFVPQNPMLRDES